VVPQVIILALMGAGLYAGYRWFARAKEMAAELQRTQEDIRRATGGAIEKNLGALEYDPASGVYRPSKRG
jgi:hypothetical protein